MAEYSLAPLRIEIVMVTPTHARALRETAHYERQRPILDGHVRRLASEMEAARFIAGTQVHICELGDKLAIVNGNHTLEAVIESRMSVPLAILYTKVNSEADIARIYANHDIGRARMWADAIRAAGLFGDMDASQQFITSFGSALLPIQLRFNDFTTRAGSGGRTDPNHMKSRSRELRVAMMREYRPQADFYYLAHKYARPRVQLWMRRSTVFSVALETFKYQPSTATEFWEGLAKDDGLKKTDPRKLLLTYLSETPASGGSKLAQVRTVASAWNAYFEQRAITFLRAMSDQPFVLRGTPWGVPNKGEPPEDVQRKAASETLALGQATDRQGHARTVATLIGNKD